VRYWWVNQTQTFEQETRGGYLWSPKRNANDHRNPFYEFMREVAPGDIVFSFYKTRIHAIGIAESYCYECPKPADFGAAGPNWANVGWKIDVRFTPVPSPLRPADHMQVLGPLLTERYAPLRPNGHGLQGIYLTALEPAFAEALLTLLGPEARALANDVSVRDRPFEQSRAPGQGQTEWEEYLVSKIRDQPIAETEKSALILARRGQGLFKQRVRQVEVKCRITGVDRVEHLRASHCKPWRDSTDSERLDGENGLLLTPTIDHLFDRGFISFETGGRLLVSPVAHRPSLERMAVPVGERVNVGAFSEGQRRYLEFHQERVFLQAKVQRDV
jgi:putative restriction endonuclease